MHKTISLVLIMLYTLAATNSTTSQDKKTPSYAEALKCEQTIKSKIPGWSDNIISHKPQLRDSEKNADDPAVKALTATSQICLDLHDIATDIAVLELITNEQAHKRAQLLLANRWQARSQRFRRDAGLILGNIRQSRPSDENATYATIIKAINELDPLIQTILQAHPAPAAVKPRPSQKQELF